MDNRILYHSALLGGIVTALMDSLPYIKLINGLCCIGIILGGIVSFVYYRINKPDSEKFSLGELVHLSLMTGLIGAIIAFALHFIFYKMVGNWEIELMINLMDTLEEIPPMWEDLYTDLTTGKYNGFAGPIILVQSLLIFPLFNFIGIMIANRFIKVSHKDKRDFS